MMETVYTAGSTLVIVKMSNFCSLRNQPKRESSRKVLVRLPLPVTLLVQEPACAPILIPPGL